MKADLFLFSDIEKYDSVKTFNTSLQSLKSSKSLLLLDRQRKYRQLPLSLHGVEDKSIRHTEF